MMEADRGQSDFRGEPAHPGTARPFMPSYRWLGYQTVEEEFRPEYPPSHAFETNAEQNSAPVQLPWRPSYLRRRVIASFICIFILILAAIEALLAISNRYDGLATSSHKQHYLWTYGPTTCLTLVAALSARAEYQSKLVAPWRRLMQQSMDAKRTLLLDYVSDFQLFVVFKALRNKDWTVSIACTVSLIIKALIIMATGLITLSWTGVHLDSHSMLLQDTFSNNARLSKTGTLSYYVMKGLSGRNLTYPDGMSKDYAFQSVLTNLGDAVETRVTVDGLTNGLDCVPADLVMTGARPANPHYADATLNVTVKAPGCNMKALRLGSPAWSGGNQNSSDLFFARFAKVQCDDTKDYEGSRVLLMFGNLTYTVDYTRNTTDYTGHPAHPVVAKLHQSTQLLCVPTYTITRVEVVRNNTETKSVEPVRGATNRTLESIQPWAIMDAHYKSYENPTEMFNSAYGGVTNISKTQVDTDQYFAVAIESQLGPNTTTQAKDMFDPVFLKQFASDYYRQFAAIVAKQSLMEPASIEVRGAATFMANRLVVRTWAAQWMAGLVVSCMALLTIALFTVPTQGILPRNPSNIPDMASLLLHSHGLRNRLYGFGAADEKDLAKGLEGCKFLSGVTHNPTTGQAEFAIVDQQKYPDDSRRTFSQIPARRNQHPGVLHPVFRLTMCTLLVGIIIALELMLQKSNREDGLGDVGNDTYMHYLWTTLPALVFGLMTMAFSSMDFRIRSLAPYMMLRNRVTTDKFMKLDHLDMSIPRTMYREVMAGNVGAFATTAMLVVASLFTIFSGSLFQALAVPNSGPMTLRANQSFDLSPFGYAEGSGSVSSLILESNLSYPSFTYRDLAFPQLLPNISVESNSTFDLSTVSIEATVPAVRSRLDCRLYDYSKHRFNHTRNYTITSHQNPLGIWIEGEECKMFPQYEQAAYNSLFSTFPNATYIGLGKETSNVSDIQGCSDLLYTWGKIDYFANPPVQHVASLGCNVTFERVDVDTTFIGTNLEIDITPEKAPRPREDTARNSTIKSEGSQTSIYSTLADIGTDPQLLSPFFSTLVSSRFAIPMADLGDGAANEKVAGAIRFQHGIIQAQALVRQQVPANATNATLASLASKTDNDAQPVYLATATDASARRRVVQDAASTRALEALLGAALALLVVGWLRMRQTDVLPLAPTTIASVAALIAGGNLVEKLPADAAWRRRADVAAALRAAGATEFWIGWGLVPDLEGRAAGGENENGFRQFGIFAVGGQDYDPAEEAEQKRAFLEQVTAYDNMGGSR